MISDSKKVGLVLAAVLGIGLYMWDDARTQEQHRARELAVETVPDWVQANYDRWTPIWMETVFEDRGAQVEVSDSLLGSFTVSKNTPYTVTCDLGMVYASFGEKQILVYGAGLTDTAPELSVDPNSRAADKIAAQVCAATKGRLAQLFR